MIRKVIDQIKSNITGLPFVERFGGVVIPVTRVNVTEDGFPVASTFPVACSVSAQQCWEQGKYQDLVPNSRYKSVFYFEERSGMNVGTRLQHKGQEIEYTGRVRLVGWLNLPKLGSTDCNLSDLIAFECMGAMNGTHELTGDLDKAAAVVRTVSQLPKTPEIFSRYSYDNNTFNFLLYPYDYFAIDFDVALLIKPDCVGPFALGTDIECVDLTE